ncbi:MAG TPA: AlpA family phage regulatory protein [Stellaceae bacterium]|nr:AlpA family phage regulatory protein [Stellaceae bacterium]
MELQQEGKAPRLLGPADLRARGITLSRSQLNRLIVAGRFPVPVQLSTHKRAWHEDEINEWIATRTRSALGRHVQKQEAVDE